ncbi:MAG: hypothetical protein Kow0032_03860 [Methyloligellaceae bacterium]
MSHTRNGPGASRTGPPCPSSHLMHRTGVQHATSPACAPSDEELARQLDAVFAEIAESEAFARDQEGHAGQQPLLANAALRRYRLSGDKMRRGASPGWLKRAIARDYPRRERRAGWRGYANSAAPLIAAALLLSLYPAFRYVLNGSEEISTVQQQPLESAVPAEQRAPAQTAASTATPLPAPAPARTVRVRTVRVVPMTAAGTAEPAPPPAAPPPAAVQPAPKAATLPPAPQARETRAPAPVARVSPPRPQATATPAPQRSGELSAAERGALMERARGLTEAGDIAGAKLAYEFLAKAGDAEAALELARLNDPEALAGMGVVGLAGNEEQALYWYNQAARLGSLDAARHVARSARR